MTLPRRRLLGGLLPLLLAGCSTLNPAFAPPETVVWVVRHAEKVPDGSKDPDLTEEGRARAVALAERLKGEDLDAIFSTATVRTRATAEPLARALGEQVRLYESKDFPALKERILQGWRGGTVLVVGHSNTVLELIEALGGQRPVPALADEDYDFLFQVTMPERGEVTVKTTRYGPAHHP